MASEDKQLTEQICALLADALQVEAGEIGPETQFGDLPQWDSMGHMEVLVALEKSHGVDITPDTITDLISVAAICEHIEGKGNG